MATLQQRRIKKVIRALVSYPFRSALLLGSASARPKSRNQFHEYRQHSDFYYLTGSDAQNALLFISPDLKQPLLFVPPVDKVKVLWEGPPPNYRQLAASLDAELVISANPEKEIHARLRGVDALLYQNEEDTDAWNIAKKLIKTPSHARGTLPKIFAHSDLIIENLRLHKEKEEIELMKRAAYVTNHALFEAVSLVRKGNSEKLIASALDFFFRANGCVPAFATNVSFGSSAATLHHEPSDRALKNGELVLIDCGAAFEYYSADITRVIPSPSGFSPVQLEAYQIVLEAQRAAIRAVKSGVLIKKVYEAAAKVMTQGLIDLKVLKGKFSKLFGEKAYQPYFPHSIGHSLGLDVHDLGNLRGNNAARLEEGMVITIEPGLYFPRAVGKVPALGIRIEDDVLVKKGGSEIISAGFPKKPKELELLVRESGEEHHHH